MNIRVFDNLKILSILMLFLLNFTGIYAQKQQPNVLLINVDDLGWKDVGFDCGLLQEGDEVLPKIGGFGGVESIVKIDVRERVYLGITAGSP